ncbi:hypothetical protein [Dyadobacter bucti]|nr:hypothetical protein [Dyadobacter bucti]
MTISRPEQVTSSGHLNDIRKYHVRPPQPFIQKPNAVNASEMFPKKIS